MGSGMQVKRVNSVARVNDLPLEKKEGYVKCASYRQKFQAQTKKALQICFSMFSPSENQAALFFSVSAYKLEYQK